jgi:hypothetical protein
MAPARCGSRLKPSEGSRITPGGTRWFNAFPCYSHREVMKKAMHDRLDAIDWSFLLDKKVEQVCVAEYQVQINTTGNVYIGISYEFRHITNDVTTVCSVKDPINAGSLVSLIGRSITNVAANGDDELILSFDDSQILTILMGHNGYESLFAMSRGRNIFA